MTNESQILKLRCQISGLSLLCVGAREVKVGVAGGGLGVKTLLLAGRTTLSTSVLY